MKKSKWWASLSLALVMSTGLAVAVGKSDKVMQRQSDGTYVVNTVTLCPTVRGFKGATPLFVYIKGGKVVKVEAQRNQESPKFFQKVRQGLLPKFAGMKLSTAANASEVIRLLLKIWGVSRHHNRFAPVEHPVTGGAVAHPPAQVL